MRKKLFLIFIFVLALLVAAGAFLFLTPAQSTAQVLALDGTCDLHVADCHAGNQTGGKLVTFALLPRQIPLMKEVLVQTRLQGFRKVSKAQVVVEGMNMFMGYQFTPLQQGADGLWQGKLVLPVCTLEVMEWQARVELSTSEGLYQASFPFTTNRQ